MAHLSFFYSCRGNVPSLVFMRIRVCLNFLLDSAARLKFLLLVAFIVVYVTGCASVQVPRCTIDDYGLIQRGDFKQQLYDKKAATGKYNFWGAMSVFKKTDRIDAQVGTTFGLLFHFENFPADSIIEQEIIHPPMLDRFGQIRTSTTYSSNSSFLGSSYTFDRPSELLAGEWTFISKFDGQEFCKKRFIVELK